MLEHLEFDIPCECASWHEHHGSGAANWVVRADPRCAHNTVILMCTGCLFSLLTSNGYMAAECCGLVWNPARNWIHSFTPLRGDAQ